MNIVIDIDHPSTVHLFKHFIREMEKRGHTVVITAMEKEVVFDLLEAEGFSYVNLGDPGNSKRQKILKLPGLTQKLYKIIKENKADLVLGASTIPGAWAAKALGVPCVNFEDTEIARQAHRLYVPFASFIVSPQQYGHDFGMKHLRYAGFKELAYVHPNRFQPDRSVLKELGVTAGESFFMVRFSAWKAAHDIGKAGMNREEKKSLIEFLATKGKVFICAEGDLEPELESYRYRLAPAKVLDVLAFATLLVTDAHTMATEAALLGTPALRYNSLVGEKDMRNFLELEECHDLMYSFKDLAALRAKAEELLKRPNLKAEWAGKVEKLLQQNVDLTAWMLDFVEEQFAVQEEVLS